MRWLVERAPDSFERVSSEWIQVQDGALVFSNPWSGIVIAFAPGQWITVVSDEGENSSSDPA